MPDTRHGSISDTALQIAEAYAVIYPARPARSKVMSWINKARAANGEKGLKPDQIRSAIDELVDARLLMPSIESRRGVASQGPGAVLGTITRFCLAAHQRGSGNRILEHFLHENRFNSHHSTQGPQLRHALINNQPGAIDPERVRDDDLLWLTEPRACLLYTSPSPRDRTRSRMPSSA